MKVKSILAACIIAAYASPTLAADEYYVVQDVKTKKCTVVDKKPTESTTTSVPQALSTRRAPKPRRA